MNELKLSIVGIVFLLMSSTSYGKRIITKDFYGGFAYEGQVFDQLHIGDELIPDEMFGGKAPLSQTVHAGRFFLGYVKAQVGRLGYGIEGAYSPLKDGGFSLQGRLAATYGVHPKYYIATGVQAGRGQQVKQKKKKAKPGRIHLRSISVDDLGAHAHIVRRVNDNLSVYIGAGKSYNYVSSLDSDDLSLDDFDGPVNAYSTLYTFGFRLFFR